MNNEISLSTKSNNIGATRVNISEQEVLELNRCKDDFGYFLQKYCKSPNKLIHTIMFNVEQHIGITLKLFKILNYI